MRNPFPRRTPRATGRTCCLGLLLLAAAAAPRGLAAEDRPAWSVPAEGACDSGEGSLLPFRPGDVFGVKRLDVLRSHLPEEIWRQRELFFHVGQRLEVGPCFRDYSPPEFFETATGRFAGRARLDNAGGIEGCVAGLPFPPETIADDDPRAGLKWAWNVAHRYRGAGRRGAFRHAVLGNGDEHVEYYEGRLFRIQLGHRADLAEHAYGEKVDGDADWVAGGRLEAPAAARGYAWRQVRHRAHEQSARRSDDLRVYFPGLRRDRRVRVRPLEGLYLPALNLAQRSFGPLGAGVVALDATGGVAGRLADPELRPLLYDYRVLGTKDVLAPINAQRAMYPENPARDFGTSGISLGDDRWDLRRVLVLEATRRPEVGHDAPARVVLHVDLQTLTPLFVHVFGADGRLRQTVIHVGRWSGDRPDYPHWPDDPELEVRVIDPVGAVAVDPGEGGSRRHEAWRIVSVPSEGGSIEQLQSLVVLTRGR